MNRWTFKLEDGEITIYEHAIARISWLKKDNFNPEHCKVCLLTGDEIILMGENMRKLYQSVTGRGI